MIIFTEQTPFSSRSFKNRGTALLPPSVCFLTGENVSMTARDAYSAAAL